MTAQNTGQGREWNSAKWIPLSPDRLKLSHDEGLRTGEHTVSKSWTEIEINVVRDSASVTMSRTMSWDLVANHLLMLPAATRDQKSWYILHHSNTSITVEGQPRMQPAHKMSGKSMFCVLTAGSQNYPVMGVRHGRVQNVQCGENWFISRIFGYLQDRTFHKCQTLSAVRGEIPAK